MKRHFCVEDFFVLIRKINRTSDKFFIWFTPKWFEFLGWLLLMGALIYVYIRSKSEFIFFIIAVSVFLIGFYIWSSLANNYFLEGYFIWLKNKPRVALLIGIFNVLLAMLLTFFIMLFITITVLSLAIYH